MCRIQGGLRMLNSRRAAGWWATVLFFCAFLLGGVSLSDPYSFPSDATHVTLVRFGSAAGMVRGSEHLGLSSLGEAVVVLSPRSSSLQTESGLLGVFLRRCLFAGDFNRDNEIDFRDLFLLQQFWYGSSADGAPILSRDLKSKGVIDHSDFYEFLRLWHRTRPFLRLRGTLAVPASSPGEEQKGKP